MMDLLHIIDCLQSVFDLYVRLSYAASVFPEPARNGHKILISFLDDYMMESYRKLKRVIMEYLGLTPAVSTESTFTSSFADTLTSGEVSDHEYSTTSGSVKLQGKSWSRRSEALSNTSMKNKSRTPGQIKPVVSDVYIEMHFLFSTGCIKKNETGL